MTEDQKAETAAAPATRDWGLPCVRAEAEAHVRSLGMRCRGPHKSELEPGDYRRLAPLVQDALRALPAPAAGEPKRSPSQLVVALLGAGYDREARLLDDFARIPCGADFADIVLANPLDGREHEYECPRCGVRGRYTAPVYSIDGTHGGGPV